MTTPEKEKRVADLGKPWTEVMKGLGFHRKVTEEEKQHEHHDAIAIAREDYYSNALSVIIDCAWREEK